MNRLKCYLGSGFPSRVVEPQVVVEIMSDDDWNLLTDKLIVYASKLFSRRDISAYNELGKDAVHEGIKRFFERRRVFKSSNVSDGELKADFKKFMFGVTRSVVSQVVAKEMTVKRYMQDRWDGYGSEKENYEDVLSALGSYIGLEEHHNKDDLEEWILVFNGENESLERKFINAVFDGANTVRASMAQTLGITADEMTYLGRRMGRKINRLRKQAVQVESVDTDLAECNYLILYSRVDNIIVNIKSRNIEKLFNLRSDLSFINNTNTERCFYPVILFSDSEIENKFKNIKNYLLGSDDSFFNMNFNYDLFNKVNNNDRNKNYKFVNQNSNVDFVNIDLDSELYKKYDTEHLIRDMYSLWAVHNDHSNRKNIQIWAKKDSGIRLRAYNFTLKDCHYFNHRMINLNDIGINRKILYQTQYEFAMVAIPI